MDVHKYYHWLYIINIIFYFLVSTLNHFHQASSIILWCSFIVFCVYSCGCVKKREGKWSYYGVMCIQRNTIPAVFGLMPNIVRQSAISTDYGSPPRTIITIIDDRQTGGGRPAGLLAGCSCHKPHPIRGLVFCSWLGRPHYRP